MEKVWYRYLSVCAYAVQVIITPHFSFVFIPLPSSSPAPLLLGGSLDIFLHHHDACNSKSEATVVEWPIVVSKKSDLSVICVAALQSNISQRPM